MTYLTKKSKLITLKPSTSPGCPTCRAPRPGFRAPLRPGLGIHSPSDRKWSILAGFSDFFPNFLTLFDGANSRSGPGQALAGIESLRSVKFLDRRVFSFQRAKVIQHHNPSVFQPDMNPQLDDSKVFEQTNGFRLPHFLRELRVRCHQDATGLLGQGQVTGVHKMSPCFETSNQSTAGAYFRSRGCWKTSGWRSDSSSRTPHPGMTCPGSCLPRLPKGLAQATHSGLPPTH